MASTKIINQYLYYYMQKDQIETRQKVDKSLITEQVKEEQVTIGKYNKKYGLLVLYACQVDINNLQYFRPGSSVVSWGSLKHVNLGNNKIGMKAIRNLSKMQLPSLQHVSLSKNSINNASCSLIITKMSWPSIKFIDLRNNFINQLELIEYANWKNIQYINTDMNIISVVNLVQFYAKTIQKRNQGQLCPSATFHVKQRTLINKDNVGQQIHSRYHFCSTYHS